MAEAVFVQPHFDDVALSCGGTVAQLARLGSPVIVTVCGGGPSDDLSAFARQQHDWWHLDDAAVVEERRREDVRAARALGQSVRTLALDIPDAIYRHPEYASEDALFGELLDADFALERDIAAQLADLGSPVFMPLAVGGHVDHQLVHRAGLCLRASGIDVWLYADLPYALQPGTLEQRLAEVGAQRAFERELSAEDFERRWRAIECYGSQLPVLFRNMDDPRGEFDAFTRDARTGRLRERFWRFDTDEETRA